MKEDRLGVEGEKVNVRIGHSLAFGDHERESRGRKMRHYLVWLGVAKEQGQMNMKRG